MAENVPDELFLDFADSTSLEVASEVLDPAIEA